MTNPKEALEWYKKYSSGYSQTDGNLINRTKGTWLTEYTEEEAEKEFPNIAKYNTSNDLISRSALMEYCSNQKSKSIDNNDIARFPSAEAIIHGRLTDASWVINEIHKKICDMCEQAIDIEDCNYCKIEKIKRIIYSAPTVSAEAKWIPVSEWLPDTDVPVLVSDGVYVWEDELQEDYEDGETIYWWDSQCGFNFDDTAWMPRPKPWKRSR